MQTLAQFQLLADDGNQNVNADGNPNLSLHSIGRSPIEIANSQVLFDPLEEEFYLPAAFVELGDGNGRQGKMIGQENKMALLFDIEEVNASQTFWIILMRIEASQTADLVGAHSALFVDGQGLVTNKVEIVLGSNHEESVSLVDGVKSGKVQVTAIHDVKSPRLDEKFVQDIDVVELSLGNLDKTGNRSSQIEQRMKFDRCFGSPKSGPSEQTQTQIDGGRIQSVNRFFHEHAKVLVGIQPSRMADEILSQIGINSPVPLFVGARQIHARHIATNPQTIKLAPSRTQTSLDVAQAFPIGQLGEAHAQKLIPTTESLNLVHAPISIDATFELLWMNPLHQLRKNGRLSVHEPILQSVPTPRSMSASSNRSHLKFFVCCSSIESCYEFFSKQRDNSDAMYKIFPYNVLKRDTSAGKIGPQKTVVD